MSGRVNLAARVGRTFLKAKLLVLKTKKNGFSRFLTSCNFLDAYIFYTYLRLKTKKKIMSYKN